MKKLYIIIGILTTMAAGSCKKFIDVNTNPNSPTTVQEKLLLAPIEYNIAFNVAEGPENVNNATLVHHFMQMLAYNQVPPNFGTYQVTTANANATWSTIYVTCLNNLKILRQISTTNNNANYTAIAEILSAYCLATVTDFYGDVPYTDALNSGNLNPKYDKQEDIYKAVQSLLDQGIADINKNVGLKPGNDDYFYLGDMAKWKKLAYTLKARYYMHLTKAPGYTATTQAALALTALQNGLSANTEDLQFNYPGAATSQNRVYQLMLPVSTLVASSAIVDTLVKRNDPRLSLLIAPAITTKLYTGRQIGAPTIGSLNNYSLIGSFYASVNSIQPILPYTEALFIKAEATLITSGIAAALPIYQSAITANMNKMGIAAASQTTYMASRGSLGNTTAQALERIMEEKKIADFLSIENFNDWRRTGYPKMTIPPNAILPNIPRIIYYPQVERDNNPQPQNTAVRALTDRVWWDAQ